VYDHVGTVGCLDYRIARLQIRMDNLGTGRESIRSRGRPDDRSDPMAGEPGTPDNRSSDRSFRAKDDELHVLPTAPSANKSAAASIGISTYVHDACTRPAYAGLATVSRLDPPR
jgi:hypothetical protein